MKGIKMSQASANGIPSQIQPANEPDATSYVSARAMSQGGGQLDGLPLWAKVGATLSAISLVCGLFAYLVVNMVHQQDAGTVTFERLIDKFDRIIEKHDERQREWMRSHGDRITSENEKTRAVLSTLGTMQEKSAQENSRLHEATLIVLKQIRDEKRMP